MSSAPQQLAQLVRRFSEQHDEFTEASYNETQLRREFIDPLFKLLGWDIENEQGFAEAYKDVIHEDALRIGESTKAPDYGFRIGGTRKFFLEAKKPSVDIERDASPAYQLRRYAWSADLQLSVLTNFERLAIYDARVRPSRTDKASTARVYALHFRDYESRWDELSSLLSREAVLRGAFDRFATSAKQKRGTARVDDAFLSDIEKWRKDLAIRIAKDNRELDARQVNTVVQATVDRLIFLRIAEDRGIERYGRLRDIASTAGIYAGLCSLFREADDRYNSGLFHFKKERGSGNEPIDKLSLALAIDDKVLKPILQGLYYPVSPYEFSVFPLDVLGQVYERFLGKQIQVSESHRATIEEKPLVRKAGGVFYTPTHVVEFIVENTLAPLLRGKRAGARGGASKLRILDPACGSGSFLISAFQYLLEWHRDRYIEEGPERHRRELVQVSKGTWVLGIEEKKRILMNNIFGVDIDEQAVEVTKLSLLLKVLEGESAQTLGSQLALFHQRVLPNLASNIRCGNSLVGTDWYGGEATHIDTDTEIQINPFDWKTEFGGPFDAVVGNPPYVSLQSGFISGDLQKYLADKYKAYDRITDYFALFVERAQSLLKRSGMFGMILPSTLLGNVSFANLRKLLLDGSAILEIVQLGDGVFRDAVVPTCIVVTRKGSPSGNKIEVVNNVVSLERREFDRTKVPQGNFKRERNFAFNISATPAMDSVIAKMNASSTPLGTLLNIKEGVKTGDDASFLSLEPFRSRSHRVLKGRDIEQFAVLDVERYIRYEPEKLSRPQSSDHFEVPEKLLIRRVGDHLTAALDSQQRYCVHTLYTGRLREGVELPLRFIEALINSRLMQVAYRNANVQKGKVFPEVRIYSLNSLPIASLDPKVVADRRRIDGIRSLGTRISNAAAEVHSAKTAHDREVWSRKVDVLRAELDEKIYELYKLTAGEIAAVKAFKT